MVEVCEWHRLLVVVAAGSVGSSGGAPLVIATQVARHPGGCAFHALVAEPRKLPLVIAENGIEGPERGWELRAPGLWADHVCESTDEHWSYGLEAFALAIDDPVELLGRAYGERTPLGWELDFEAQGPPEPTGPTSSVQPGVVHGLLLGPAGQLEIEGRAQRGWCREAAPGPGAGPGDPGHRLGQHLELATAAGTAGPAGTIGTGAERSGTLEGSDDAVVTEVALPTPEGVWWVARTASGVRTRGC